MLPDDGHMVQESPRRWPMIVGICLLTALLAVACFQHSDPGTTERSFKIANDTFVKDGKTFQIISGRYSTYLRTP